MTTEYIDYIDDRGVIESIDAQQRQVTVRIAGEDGCSACPASKLCAVTSSPDKVATVAVDSPSQYHLGQRVVLRGSERMHRKAIMLATVLPCICLIAIMVAIYLLTGNELAAALSGAGATIVFYFVLWLMRNKIAHEFQFEIKPINE